MSFTFERFRVPQPKSRRARGTRAEQQRKLDEAIAKIPDYEPPAFNPDLRPDYIPPGMFDDWPELPPPIADTRLGERIELAIAEFTKQRNREPSVIYLHASVALRDVVIRFPIKVVHNLTVPFLVA